VKPEDVKIVKSSVDYGDERSSGAFHVEAETPLGLLVGDGTTGTGDDQATWTLAGSELGSEWEYPDLGVPHLRDGGRALARFEAIRDAEAKTAISEFLTGYSEDMAGI